MSHYVIGADIGSSGLKAALVHAQAGVVAVAERSYPMHRPFPGAAENDPEARVSPGERYARIYEINLARCIFCGYCEIACPFDAITLGNDFELSELSRDALVATKDVLLEPPVTRERTPH